MAMGTFSLDALLIVAILLVAIASLYERKASLVRRAAIALSVVTVLHLVVAGFRWQILPAYLAALLAVMLLQGLRRWLHIVCAGITLSLTVIAGAASWAFPVFDMPKANGDYAVGTATTFLTDEDREEHYTERSGDKRRLALRIWYPSDDPESGTATRYFHDAGLRSKAITSGTPLPWFTFSHLDKVRVAARKDASIAEGRFPVLIYSHGLGIGWSSGNTALVEHLASHGYIVIGVGHAYIGSSVVFPDGVALFDPDTRAAMNTEPPEEVMAVYREVKDIQDPSRQLEVFMRAMAMMPTSIKGKVDQAIRTQVADQHFVLDALPSLKPTGVDLKPHMDTEKVGVFGMSIGGSAAVLTCSAHANCGAVANLDGFHPDQANVELPVPSLALHRSDNLLVSANADRSLSDAYLLEITETTHFNFFDFALMSPLYRQLGVLGAIDGKEGLEIQRDYIAAFFDQYLKGSPSPLIQGKEAHSSPHAKLKTSVRAFDASQTH